MPSHPNPDSAWTAAGAIALAAACYAAAELLLTVTLGGFFAWGRAEALLFLAWRPWLLIAAALIAASFTWRRRLAFYALALPLAGLCESVLLLRLGAGNPWSEMVRGLAAAALLLIPVELVIQAGRLWLGRLGAPAAAAAATLLLLIPAVRAPYDTVVIGPGTGIQPRRYPSLLVMTSLPIVWGEGGAFDPRSRPALSYRVLQEDFAVRPIDTIDAGTLPTGKRMMLLAQPRWLAPAELVALDAWVRRGGRVTILADPSLVWPSDLPLGDVRRPVPSSLLGPLLSHWGLELIPLVAPGRQVLEMADGKKLVLDSPGRFRARGEDCVVEAQPVFALCRIGRGRARLVADADLLRDDLWVAPGRDGDARHRRTADNPLALVDLIEELGGIWRERSRGRVAWARPDAPRDSALALALLPAILVAGAGLLLRRRGKFRPQRYPQADKA